jgi:hypothetical protein
MSDEFDSPESHVRARTPEQVAAAEQKAKPLGQIERAPRNDDDYVECGKALLKALATPLTLNRIRRWGETPGGFGRSMAEETLYWLDLHKRVAILRKPDNPQKMFYDPLMYSPPMEPLVPMCSPPMTSTDTATKVEAEARHDDTMKVVDKHMKPLPRRAGHAPPVPPARKPFPSKEEVRAHTIARLKKAHQENSKPMANEHLITKIEAAKILGVKPSWLGPKAHNKGLKRERIEGKFRYDEESVRALAVLRAKNGETPTAGKTMSKTVGHAPKGQKLYKSEAPVARLDIVLSDPALIRLDTILKAHSLGIFDDAEALAKIKQIFRP